MTEMQDLKRLPDWRSRFDAFCDGIRFEPFAWGSHDCGPGLAGGAVFALTGVDIAGPYKGQYASELEGLALVKAAGFASLPDLVASLLPEIPPSMARIGDIVAFEIAGTAMGWGLGVVNGERFFVLRPEGQATLGLLMAKRAFKVGE